MIEDQFVKERRSHPASYITQSLNLHTSCTLFEDKSIRYSYVSVLLRLQLEEG